MRLSRLAALVMVAILQIGTLIPQEASAAPPAITAWEAQRFRTEAKRLADKDRYREAIPLAEKALAFEEQQNPPKNPLKLAEALVLLADITFKNGELKRAEGLYDRALAIREKELGPDHPLVADVLHGLAGIHLERWSFRKAEELTRRAVAIREKRFGADSLEVAEVRVRLGAILRGRDQFKASREELTKALAIRERLRGTEHPDVADVLDELGDLEHIVSALPQAKAHYERALAIRDKALGPDSLGSTKSMLGLAEMLMNGPIDQALSLGLRILDIRERALHGAHLAVAHARGLLGWLYFHSRELDKAKREVVNALSVFNLELGQEGAVLRLAYAKYLIFIYMALGDYGAMYEVHSLTTKLADASAEFPAFVKYHYLISDALFWETQGEFSRAESKVRGAEQFVCTQFGERHYFIAFNSSILARLVARRGDYAAAESLMVASVRDAEQLWGASTITAVSDRLNLGFLLLGPRSAGPAKRALPLFRAVIDIAALNDDHFANMCRAYAYHGLASAYLIAGEVNEARLWIEHALPIFNQIFPPESPYLARPLWTLSSIQVADGESARAEDTARKALDLEEGALGANHPTIGLGLANLSEIVLASGHLDEAIALMQRAADLWERQTQRMIAGGSEEQRRAFFAMLQQDTDAAISLAVRHAPAADLALTVILRRKGRVIDAMHDTFSELRRNLDPQAQNQFQRLRDVQREISMHYTATSGGALSDKSRERVQALEKEREDLERDLSLRSTDFERETKPLDIATVQVAIPEHATLVEIVAYRPFHAGVIAPDKRWGKRRYAAYVLHRKGNVALADLGEGVAIDAAVERFRTALSDPGRDAKKPARDLDALVMAPIRRLLGDAHHVLMSPDGALNLVPFGALVDEKGQYLLENYDFTYLTSGRDLLRAPAQHSVTHEPVIFANPDFGPGNAPIATDKQRGVRSAALGMLPPFEQLTETEVEAQQIAKSLSGAQILLGENANEEALKALQAPRILHLATHAFFLPKEVVENESTAEGEGAGRLELRRENRLLRSGLALAGANARKSRIDDGIVTALEASGLNLDGTKLVSLSACETAVGNASDGDGVYGLRRALLFAGAETQVLSLWKVDDQATRQLMVGYYQKLAHGAGRSAAMRDVALAMLHNSPLNHPYFGAGFIVSGNWRSLEGTDVGPIVPTVAPGPRGCQCEMGANLEPVHRRLAALVAPGMWSFRRRRRNSSSAR